MIFLIPWLRWHHTILLYNIFIKIRSSVQFGSYSDRNKQVRISVLFSIIFSAWSRITQIIEPMIFKQAEKWHALCNWLRLLKRKIQIAKLLSFHFKNALAHRNAFSEFLSGVYITIIPFDLSAQVYSSKLHKNATLPKQFWLQKAYEQHEYDHSNWTNSSRYFMFHGKTYHGWFIVSICGK